MVNHLTKRLPIIISDNQSGFVSSRLISENILLARELIGKTYKENKRWKCSSKVGHDESL